MSPLLSLCISVDYARKPILRDLAFDINEAEIFGLAGPSGAGKSTIALAILRLLDMRGGSVRGSILFHGRDLMTCRERDLRHIRGREIAMVPQSPVSALNPALRLETHLREAWRAHSSALWPTDHTRPRFERMDLPTDAEFLRRYPSQISVGQAQRVLIAMAMLHKPRLILADEPTSALDPESRAGILSLFRDLNRDYGVAILYISHDLASMEEICHRSTSLERC